MSGFEGKSSNPTLKRWGITNQALHKNTHPLKILILPLHKYTQPPHTPQNVSEKGRVYTYT